MFAVIFCIAYGAFPIFSLIDIIFVGTVTFESGSRSQVSRDSWFFTRLNQLNLFCWQVSDLQQSGCFFTYNYKRSFLSQASSLTKITASNMLSWLGSVPG